MCATNVRTGRGRIFRNRDITPDVLLASACLPQVFPPVEIEGELYWDGGYAGNPSLAPLIRGGQIRGNVTFELAGKELPVFGSVKEAMAETGADVSVVFVPPAFTKDACIEAIDAGIGLVTGTVAASMGKGQVRPRVSTTRQHAIGSSAGARSASPVRRLKHA